MKKIKDSLIFMLNMIWESKFALLKATILTLALTFIIPVENIYAGNNTQNDGVIKGVVKDDTGQIIPGATVVVKGTANGTITDSNGSYILSHVASDAIVVVSFVGMETMEIPVAGKATINVTLKSSTIGLNEVVAIGYGVVKKSDLTGSVASIKSEDIANNPTNNALETLQGRVSGIDLTKSSGKPGAGVSMSMRGERSLNASNAPLVMVDGVAYGSTVDINPTDIESIEVLKDASSTAIYGSRGANGVILITTKRGKEGKPSISVNVYHSFNTLASMPEYMNAEQYADLKREVARSNDNWSSTADDANALGSQQIEYLNAGYSADWFDLVLHNGYTTNYEVAMRGSNKTTNYSLSFGIQDEQGLLKTVDHFNRYTGRLSIDHKILTNLKIGANIMYTYKNQDDRNASFWNISKYEPIAKPYNDDGSVNMYPIADRSDVLSPLADDVDGAVYNNTVTSRVFGIGFLEWTIIDNLFFKTTLGVNQSYSRNGYFNSLETTFTEEEFSESGATNKLDRSLTWENTLNYNLDISEKHNFSFLAGTSTITNHSEEYELYGKNQALDELLCYSLSTTTDGVTIDSDLTESQLASFFGRVNYKFDERFLLTATVRADGSSVLAEGNKWGYFPSVAAGWRINQESWMANADAVSNLKLRLSWGKSGQSGIDPYSTMALLSTTTYAWNETGAYGYYPSTISNPDLKWETTTVFDVGFDLGLWNNRVNATIDYYKSVTSDILMERSVPSTSGFSSVYQNIGETEGSGIDATLSTLNISKQNFRWSTDFNFSYNHNEITKLTDGVDQNVDEGWFVGESLNVFYDYKKIGIWQTAEEEKAATYDQEPGQIKVKDVDEDGAISDEDRVVYEASPKFTFGLTNRFSYKNLDLSFFLYGRFGHTIEYEYYESWRPGSQENDPNVDYWTPENPTNNFPRPVSETVIYKSSLNYAKGDFLKVKDITLAYNLSKKMIDRLGLSRLRFYVTLKNHFVFSELDNYDPERGGSISYPLTKQTVFGVNLEF